ncbi:MAG: 1,4-alpha-glucan branching protein domain-containing protein [Thermomicrobiales bacterium]
MTPIGAFTFMLHSHLPYARQAGMWPHGEEWVHEAIAETYVPLLNALYDLREEGIPYRLTIGITPVLAEQLADPLIVEHFINYASERAARAAQDVDRFERAGNQEMRDLARYYHHWYARVLTSFQDRFGSALLAAFRSLQDEGHVEIATSAATHGYLPLLARDSSIHGQLRTGVNAYARHFGKRPQAIWLPECAYRPAVLEDDAGTLVRRPGLESFLAEEGLLVFFSETHTVEGGKPVGMAVPGTVGPYGMIARRYATSITPPSPDQQLAPGTSLLPYWVGDAPGQVAVLARHERTGQQVWSATFGYPGDFVYREFHRKDATSGLQYWRISGAGVDLGQKAPYAPETAAVQVRSHAEHYVNLIETELRSYHDRTGAFGSITASYDTELFGHWWFEGVDWLKHVLRLLAERPAVAVTSASRIIEQHPPREVLSLPESSWGAGGSHFTWLNDDTAWMWPLIHTAERRMEGLVESNPDASGIQREVLDQAARELLLLQSSDWPFLVTTGQAREYAVERFQEHLARFDQLTSIVAQGMAGADVREMLDALRERDNPFPGIDYRDWAARQGYAGAPPVRAES